MAITYEMNLVKLAEVFHSEDACRNYLAELRWPDGVQCPRCESKSLSTKKARDQYDCNSCRYQFSVTSGTIFHDSHLPLWKWFLAAYLTVESKKGISANQVKRMIKVSYKTAWYLCHRIRTALKDADGSLLKGIVEVDETYIGGRRKGMGRRYTGNKSMVLGAVERGGSLRLKVGKRATRKALHAFIGKHADPATERIMTDQLPAYRGIADHDTTHETVNHSAEEWVRGDVHTNTIEGAFSLFKRSVVGAYHKISAKHLPAYLDEFEFRYGNRDNPYLFRDTMKRLVSSGIMPFEKLIA